MRTTLLIALLFFTLQGFTQTFKISAVETADPRNYQKVASEALNSSIRAIFNDGAVTISLVGENRPFVLILQKDGNYSFTTEEGNGRVKYEAIFEKTLGVITSMEFSGTRVNSYKEKPRFRMIAKRQYL